MTIMSYAKKNLCVPHKDCLKNLCVKYKCVLKNHLNIFIKFE